MTRNAQERSSERLHDNVAEQLKEVIEGSVAMQLSTPLGFSVDVAATKKRSSHPTTMLGL